MVKVKTLKKEIFFNEDEESFSMKAKLLMHVIFIHKARNDFSNTTTRPPVTYE